MATQIQWDQADFLPLLLTFHITSKEYAGSTDIAENKPEETRISISLAHHLRAVDILPFLQKNNRVRRDKNDILLSYKMTNRRTNKQLYTQNSTFWLTITCLTSPGVVLINLRSWQDSLDTHSCLWGSSIKALDKSCAQHSEQRIAVNKSDFLFLSLPLIHCDTLDKSLKLCMSQFPHCKMETLPF